MNQKNETKSQFFAYIQITRPLNCIFGSLTVVVGILNAFIGVDFFSEINNIIALCGGICIYIFVGAAANVINDVFDIEIDKINRPNRAIPSGKIQKRSAIIYSSILFGIGLAIAIPLAFLTPNNFLIPIMVIVFGFIGFLYSWKGKSTGILGNIMIAISLSFGLPFGAFLITPFIDIPPKIWFFFMTGVLELLSREIVKGMEDIEGDSKFNVNTVAIAKGFRFAAWLSGVLSIAAILVFAIPGIIYHLNIWFMIAMVIGNVFVLVSIIFLIKPDRKENQTRASLALKIGAYIGVVAYVLAFL